MWLATRKAADLIKLVTYCNNMNAYCANLLCTHPHAHTQKRDSSVYRLVFPTLCIIDEIRNWSAIRTLPFCLYFFYIAFVYFLLVLLSL